MSTQNNEPRRAHPPQAPPPKTKPKTKPKKFAWEPGDVEWTDNPAPTRTQHNKPRR